jgi:hypothetical protein
LFLLKKAHIGENQASIWPAENGKPARQRHHPDLTQLIIIGILTAFQGRFFFFIHSNVKTGRLLQLTTATAFFDIS